MPTLAFLHQAGVQPLFSPAYTPSYNGSLEAGIGSLKARTEVYASRQDHPGQWTWDDVAAAQEEANATARPQGECGPTPERLLTLAEGHTGRLVRLPLAPEATGQRPT